MGEDGEEEVGVVSLLLSPLLTGVAFFEFFLESTNVKSIIYSGTFTLGGQPSCLLSFEKLSSSRRIFAIGSVQKGVL